MAETDLHRDLMVDLIQTLQDYYAREQVYVSGNLLVFYAPGDRRRHLAPDVFVVKGVPKHRRDNYLIWQEGRGPDLVIELTSATTRDEDIDHMMTLYRDVLHVPEYFLFDPNLDYLKPPFQGFRLQDGQYMPIEPVDGRLPSEVLGLHLERDGRWLRLYDPQTGRRIPTRAERGADAAAAELRGEAMRLFEEARRLAETARLEVEEVRRSAQAIRDEAQAARREAEAARQQEQAAQGELQRLRRELDQLRQTPPSEDPS
jgi:Uma2 family endonuclease